MTRGEGVLEGQRVFRWPVHVQKECVDRPLFCHGSGFLVEQLDTSWPRKDSVVSIKNETSLLPSAACLILFGLDPPLINDTFEVTTPVQTAFPHPSLTADQNTLQ